MTGPNIVTSRFRAESEFDTPERCSIVEIHNRPEDPECSIARARVAPGVTTELHALRNTDERYVILAGEGVAKIGGEEPIHLHFLDVVVIPAGTSQQITNIGRDDLVFLAVCTPRFHTACYEKRDA